MSKYRSRNHCLLLYPENEDHRKAVEIIEQNIDYALILHDKDTWTEEDEKKNPEHKAGVLKKPHWHIVLRFGQAVWNTAVAKKLGIETNYIQECNKFDNAMQYLIHYNDNDKAQYDIEEVKGNLKNRLVEVINKNEKSESEKVNELLEYITAQSDTVSVTELAQFCANNGYWAEFRRSGFIFIKILEEHNSKFWNERPTRDN